MGTIAAMRADSLPPRAAPVSLRAVGDFAALGSGWDALHARAPATSVFNSFAWQREWWRAYGRNRQLAIFVVERAGALAGILPLYLEQVRRCGVPVRLARLVGSGGDTYPDDLGPVVEDDAAADALAQAALRLDADVVELADLDPRTGFAEIVAAQAAGAGWRASRGRAQRIAYLDLPASWEAYLASVSAHRRARIRKARRRIAKAGPVRFHVWDDAATLGEALARLAALHHRRWEAAGKKTASFSTPQYLAFHRAVMEAMLARGMLRLYCLELDRELVAMLYAYRFRRGIYVMQAGFDPARGALHPGHVLLYLAIEHAIGEGNAVFDFLRGEHSYKHDLATASRETVSVTLLRPGLAASAWRLRERALPQWKRRLKRTLHPG
jgi:CelD/BcsL family acetyltransferase involved in cellulose biosynthesis